MLVISENEINKSDYSMLFCNPLDRTKKCTTVL